MSLKSYKKIRKIGWDSSSRHAGTKEKKKLKLGHNCSVQVNFSISVFFDNFSKRKLCKNWTRLFRKYILKTVVKIFRVPLDRFCWNLQGLCKKTLSSKLGEL